ncbi:MAG TPA: TetR/AcrR family transcriptional regulator [Bacilli bacterium]|nr:TetR/AcrR family transcriptional regulator [Bacilli bacterium]
MPTRTFTNLPKEKRLRILRAAKKEFSRVPLEKAVIANIVKDAEIPRGSFYQYFENVDDLFIYLMNYMYGIDQRRFTKCVEEKNGDVYEALKLKFSKEIDKLTTEENRQFRINVFSTLFNDPKKARMHPGMMEKQNPVGIVNFSETQQKSKGTNSFAEIIKMIGFFCLQKYLANQASEKEIKTYYNSCIDFIKMGFNGPQAAF